MKAVWYTCERELCGMNYFDKNYRMFIWKLPKANPFLTEFYVKYSENTV